MINMSFISEELIFRIKDENTLRKSRKGFWCPICSKDFGKNTLYIGGKYKWNVKKCVECFLKSLESEKKNSYKSVDELMNYITKQKNDAIANKNGMSNN